MILFSAWGGIVLFLAALSAANITSLLWLYVAVATGIVFGIFVGKVLGNKVTVVGTALTGSFLLVRGIASFAGDYPSTFDLMAQQPGGVQEYNPMVLAYIGGMIVSSILGMAVQFYVFKGDLASNDYSSVG